MKINELIDIDDTINNIDPVRDIASSTNESEGIRLPNGQ